MKIKLTESQLKLVLKEAQNICEDVIQPELKNPTIPCKSYKGKKTKVWNGLTNACIKTSNLKSIGKFNVILTVILHTYILKLQTHSIK